MRVIEQPKVGEIWVTDNPGLSITYAKVIIKDIYKDANLDRYYIEFFKTDGQWDDWPLEPFMNIYEICMA